MRYQLTIEGKSFTFTRLIDDQRPEALAYYENRSYHCPQCGDVWATWAMEPDKENTFKGWYPYRRSCARHPTGAWTGDNPGSIVMYHTDLAVLPHQALERELCLSSLVPTQTIPPPNDAPESLTPTTEDFFLT